MQSMNVNEFLNQFKYVPKRKLTSENDSMKKAKTDVKTENEMPLEEPQTEHIDFPGEPTDTTNENLSDNVDNLDENENKCLSDDIISKHIYILNEILKFHNENNLMHKLKPIEIYVNDLKLFTNLELFISAINLSLFFDDDKFAIANAKNLLARDKNIKYRKDNNYYHVKFSNSGTFKKRQCNLKIFKELSHYANTTNIELKNHPNISIILEKFIILIHYNTVRKYLLELKEILFKLVGSIFKDLDDLRKRVITNLIELNSIPFCKVELIEGLHLLLKLLQTFLFGKTNNDIFDVNYELALRQCNQLKIYLQNQIEHLCNGNIEFRQNYDIADNQSIDLFNMNYILDIVDFIWNNKPYANPLPENISENDFIVKKSTVPGTYSPKIPMYKMESTVRGYCLIINNENVKKEKTRFGSINDVHAVWNIFNDMGFVVEKYQDVTLQNYKEIVADTKKNPLLADVDCFVFIYMSHGNEDPKTGNSLVATSCGTDIDVYDIADQFNNHNCCKLRGKPKIFLFQSCRGNNSSQGVPIDENKENREFFDSMTGVRTENKIRKHSDILLGYATMKGHVSVRYSIGSWYIQTLCDILKENAMDTHFQDILRLVSLQFEKYESLNLKLMQTPTYTDNCFKICYLNPGYYKI